MGLALCPDYVGVATGIRPYARCQHDGEDGSRMGTRIGLRGGSWADPAIARPSWVLGASRSHTAWGGETQQFSLLDTIRADRPPTLQSHGASNARLFETGCMQSQGWEHGR